MPGKPPRAAWAGAGRITGRDDARRVMADINGARLGRNTTALASRLVQPAGEVGFVEADIARVLPAHPALAGLLPWPGGIRRGATVAAVGSTSVLIALLASAIAEGSWGAVVGMPAFGVLAAAEANVPIQRLALVPEPGPDWPTVVSALIDGVDIVVVATPPGVSDSVTRALMNRARQKNTVLVPTTVWTGCDLVITLTGRRWTGLGRGRGRLRRQEMSLESVGRGRAMQPRTVTVTMPALSEPVTSPAHVERARIAAADHPWGDVQRGVTSLRIQNR